MAAELHAPAVAAEQPAGPSSAKCAILPPGKLDTGGFVDQSPAPSIENAPRIISVNDCTGITAYINANVNGASCKLLVDSGAAVTVISREIYEQMPSDLRPTLNSLSDNIQLQAADNGLLTVHGVINMSVYIDNDIFEWTAYVADISEDGLLGLDFLHNFDCIFEVRRGLRIGNRLYPIEFQSDFVHNAVYVQNNVVVPPNCEFIVPGKCSVPDSEDIEYAIIEPHNYVNKHSELHVASCLVDLTRTDIELPVRVVNLSNDPITLHEGTRIATLSFVDDVYELDDDHGVGTHAKINNVKVDSRNSNMELHEWSRDLNQLYDRSCTELNSSEKDKLFALFEKHESTFANSPTDLGRTSVVQHTIDTGDAVPIKQRPRRPPRAFIEEEEKIIETQLKTGVIRESTSPWSSPLVYVRKRDGTTRPCVDYRKLNEVTKKDAYPLPRIEDCLDCLGGAKVFSTLDLQSGYWQIDLKEEDRAKTAFSTRSGHYEYVTMPFGLCNAPSTFERAMELIMKGLQWKTLILYLDDIIVLSSTFDEHIERLDEVLSRLGQAGLKLKPSKCHMFKSEVAYLGHVVSAAGIKPDPEKLERIQDWPSPTSVSELRSFLGLCSYYRRFIRGFSTIAAPLNKLLEKSTRFEWNETCQSAFVKLKSVLVSDHVMAYPDDHGLFILDTDASATGIGAVLSQVQWDDIAQQEVERPIAFASRSLTRTQRRYCTTRRELLAVVSFVRHFRHFLLGRKFLIRTDHSSLRWIMSFREPTDQMARWIEILSQYDFMIEHRDGKKHGNADAMSRMPCDPDHCDCYDKNTILDELPCGGCTTCRKRHRDWSTFLEDDDVVPLSVKTVRPPRETKRTRESHAPNDNHSRDTGHNNTGRVYSLVTIMLIILCFPVVIECGYLHFDNLIAMSCVIGFFAIVVCGCYYEYCVLRLMRRDNWPFPAVSSVNYASVLRNRVRHRNRAADVADEDDLSCASDKGTSAGFVSGQQEVLVNNFSREDLIKMQRNDPDIGIILRWMTTSEQKPTRELVHDKSPAVRNLWLSWSQLKLVDGLLYKRHDTNSKLTTTLQLVVPLKLRDRILHANHSSPMSGHLGIKKTLSRIQRSFYWHNMKDSVRLFIANCVVCGARKRPTSKPRAPLGEYNVGAPMDRVALDIMGPFPVSDKGNRYVLVVGDQFTKWIEAYAIPDQSALTVANVVVHEFISRFGTPLEIHSDQGKTFESNLFQSVCKLLDISKTRTTPYHPSSNGMIERFNQTLVNMISSFVDKRQHNWDEHLPLLTSAYRSAVHESTGFSPNLLMLGREVRTPIEIALGVDRPDTDLRDHDDYAADIAATMEESHRLAREHLATSTARQKRDYDTKLSVNNYKVGDFVYFFDSTKTKGLSPKLKTMHWIGPCVVTRKFSELIFEIRVNQSGKSKILHHDRLKPFVSKNIPTWAKKLSDKVKLEQACCNKRQAATQTNPKDILPPRRSSRTPNPPKRFGFSDN